MVLFSAFRQHERRWGHRWRYWHSRYRCARCPDGRALRVIAQEVIPLSPDGWLSESIAYIGMMSILLAFLLETRDVLHSKQPLYLFLMAFGSGLLGVRAFLIDEWAFLVLEVVSSAAQPCWPCIPYEVHQYGRR